MQGFGQEVRTVRLPSGEAKLLRPPVGRSDRGQDVTRGSRSSAPPGTLEVPASSGPVTNFLVSCFRNSLANLDKTITLEYNYIFYIYDEAFSRRISMNQGGRPKASLCLSDDERQRLKTWASRPQSTQRLATRARIILACSEGL